MKWFALAPIAVENVFFFFFKKRKLWNVKRDWLQKKTKNRLFFLILAVPSLKNWCFAGHQSSEPAHKFMLQKLGLVPLLDLNLRLGEGSGAALSLGLLQDANELINQMSTFADLIS